MEVSKKRLERKANGQCVYCGKADDRTKNGKTRCAECNALNTERARGMRYLWRQAHRCTSCGRKMPDDWYYVACPICRERNLKRTRAAYHAKSKSTAAEKEAPDNAN